MKNMVHASPLLHDFQSEAFILLYVALTRVFKLKHVTFCLYNDKSLRYHVKLVKLTLSSATSKCLMFQKTYQLCFDSFNFDISHEMKAWRFFWVWLQEINWSIALAPLLNNISLEISYFYTQYFCYKIFTEIAVMPVIPNNCHWFKIMPINKLMSEVISVLHPYNVLKFPELTQCSQSHNDSSFIRMLWN